MSTRKCTLAHLCRSSHPMRGHTPVPIIASIVRSHTCVDYRVHCAVAHLCGSSRPLCGRTPVRIIASIARTHTCADHRVHCAVAHLCGSSRPLRGRTPVRIIASNARSHTCADHRFHCAGTHLCESSRPMRGHTPVRIIASNARTHLNGSSNTGYARVIGSSMVKQISSTRRGSENVICDIACVVRTSSLSSRRFERKRDNIRHDQRHSPHACLKRQFGGLCAADRFVSP